MTNSTKESSSGKTWLIIGGVIAAIVLVGLLGWKITKISLFGFLEIVPPEATTVTQTGNTSSSGTLLLDGFDKSSYDGKYNTALWSCFGCDEFGVVTVTQDNSAIRLDATNKGNFENHSGGLVSQPSWLSSEIGYIEAKMKLLVTDSGGANILLRVPLEGTMEWAASCWIQRFSETQAEFSCDVSTFMNQQYVGEYKTESFPVKYDEWHTAKIELTPQFKLRFYFDGKSIGDHTPADANLLKAKHLSASLGVYTETKLTAFFDDYVVSKAP